MRGYFTIPQTILSPLTTHHQFENIPKTIRTMNNFKKQLVKLGLQALIAALTALLTALGVTACR
ncbi:MAG: smalltalk protein [Prevotella sp.]|nr:smalltalk protein [Prevotella sp.]